MADPKFAVERDGFPDPGAPLPGVWSHEFPGLDSHERWSPIVLSVPTAMVRDEADPNEDDQEQYDLRCSRGEACQVYPRLSPEMAVVTPPSDWAAVRSKGGRDSQSAS